MADTSCIYCGSPSYGKHCLYSPTDTHVHMDEPGKCIYCGSPYVGGGCLYNPYGNIHVKGPEFLNRSAVQTEKAAVLTYIFNVASSLIKENEQYRSPLDRLYKRMVSIIASITEPLLETFSLQETPSYGKLSKKELIETVSVKNNLIKDLENLSKTIQEASLKLPQEIVEKTLVDAIMSFDVRKKED
jgi:hypothetical protein